MNTTPMNPSTKRTTIVLVMVVVTLIASCKSLQVLTTDDELYRQINGEAILLDVRTAAEYADGHLEGSVNIPLGKLRTDYARLDPNRTYVTYCSHGLRSVKATDILKDKGFKHVFNGGPMSNVAALRDSQDNQDKRQPPVR